MKNPIIKINNLNFRYGIEYILKDINLTIDRGEFIVVVGARGAGKSTFLKLLSGLISITEGDVIYNSINLRTASKQEMIDIHRRTSFVFQDSALISNMKIFDNIALPLRYNEIYPEEEIQEIVLKKLEYVGLVNTRSILPAFISTGQRKLIALVRAVVVNPETVFYDEPISTLDRPSRKTAKKIFQDMRKENVTSIVVTSEIKEFASFIDHIVVLKDKTVYKVGTLDEIKNSKDEYINSLIE